MNFRRCFLAVVALAFGTMSQAADVQQVVFKSEALSLDKKMTVLVPDSYAAGDKKYPVVLFLHGYGGGPGGWAKHSTLAAEVDKYGIIAVCTDGTRDSWYFDSPLVESNKYETFIFKDVVTYIDGNYRTYAKNTKRGITGLSMGGHGAMFVGLRHPEVFGTICSMSGGLDIRPFPNNWNLKHWLGDIKEHSGNWDKYTAINQLSPKTASKQNFLFDCGTEDFFIGVNRAMHKKMQKLKIKHIYEEYPGSHNWKYWKLAVIRHMAFFKKSFDL